MQDTQSCNFVTTPFNMAYYHWCRLQAKQAFSIRYPQTVSKVADSNCSEVAL